MINDNSPQEVWDPQLTAIKDKPADWLWQGFVALGNMTLLTGMWKGAGKTTLLSLLLSRRREGGNLAGLPVKPGKTVIVTEESTALWGDRARQLDFGGQACFFSRPFLTIPTPEQWHDLMRKILNLRQAHGIDLAVIDPLAPFLQCENNARSIFETILPLCALTRAGMAVVAMHHPAKGAKPAGEAARGSGALLGHVDISIEMRLPTGDPLTRRRRLLALSRYAETPRQLLVELNAAGSDYLVLAEDDYEDQFQANWGVLRMVLNEARKKVTRLEILDDWPPDFDSKPHPSTFSRWLSRAVERGLIACDGTGMKNSPFRYWLPEREAVWRQDPLYILMEEGDRERTEILKTLEPSWEFPKATG